MAEQPPGLVAHLVGDRGHEPVVGQRVVEGREHQVLPDQQPELVAALVEGVGLVRRDAGHPDQVEAERDGLVERGQVAGRPHRTATEDPDAVDPEVQRLLGAVLDRPEADPAHHLAVDHHVVELRHAMGVRPPELDLGELEPPLAVDLHHPGGPLEPRAQPRARPFAGHQDHRAVGPHHRRTRREARRPAEQLGAHPAESGVLDQHRAPALPGLARQRVQEVGERVHDDAHLVLTGVDVDRVPLEHRASGRDDGSVDQEVPDGRDPADLEHAGLGGGASRDVLVGDRVRVRSGLGRQPLELQDGPHRIQPTRASSSVTAAS